MIIEHYKLWGLLPTAENLKELRKQKYFYANSDHCLVVAEEAPAGAVEMTEEYIRLFRADDWAWIYAVGEQIRREQEEKYHEEILMRQKEFLALFEAELEARKAEVSDGGSNTEN